MKLGNKQYQQNKNKKRKQIVLILFVFISLFFTACASDEGDQTLPEEEFQQLADNGDVLKAQITRITDFETNTYTVSDMEQTTHIISFEARILEKEYPDTVLNGRQTLDSMFGYQEKTVEEGDRIFLYPVYDESGNPIGEMAGYDRTRAILVLALVFALVLLAFSGLKGLRALIALLISVGSIFVVFIPLVLNGQSPIYSSILVCIINIAVTLVLVYGLNSKTFSAAGGCFIGVVIAGIITFIMQGVMHLNGLGDEQAVMLQLSYDLDMNGLLFAAIIIGALGAAMDVAISIASSLEEIARHTESKLSMRSLFRSGMRIGSDIMGTMTNTLILAYIGSGLPMVLLLYLNSVQLQYVISWEMLSAEVLRALAGSIGLICVVPATSVVSAFLISKAETRSNLIKE